MQNSEFFSKPANKKRKNIGSGLKSMLL